MGNRPHVDCHRLRERTWRLHQLLLVMGILQTFGQNELHRLLSSHWLNERL